MAINSFLALGDITGESRDPEFADTIDVIAWSFGMSQSGTTHLGRGGGGGKVSVNDLSITKWIDKSSPTLMQACCAGKHFPSAALMCRRAGKKPVPLIKIEMEEVMVSSVATGHAERDDRPTENITLNFAKFKVTYTPTKPDGSAAAPIGPMGWDISANTKL